MPPRGLRGILDETAKAIIDCLVTFILLTTAAMAVIDIAQEPEGPRQISRLRQRRKVHVPLMSLSLRSCCTSGERHVHGHLLVAPAGACATVAAASSRPIVYQQNERCAMQTHVVTVVISFFLETFSWHQEGRPVASVTPASACVPPAKTPASGRTVC